MTTIAYDGITMASDSQITNDNLIIGHQSKIHRVMNGYLLVAGDIDDTLQAINWFRQGMPEDIKPTLESFVGLYVPDVGDPTEYNYRLLPSYTAMPWAGGSGRDFAYTALRLGKTAKEAVEIACQMDIYSGGEVYTVVRSK